MHIIIPNYILKVSCKFVRITNSFYELKKLSIKHKKSKALTLDTYLAPEFGHNANPEKRA